MRRRFGRFPFDWQGKFKECGYRITIAREVILKILHNTSKHLSAEEIFLEVYKEYPNIGLTTVYRTLDLLTRLGIVSKNDFGDNRARYELSFKREKFSHHHHLICTGCGMVIDYDDFMDKEVEFLKYVEEGLSKKFNFKIKSHLMQFYGLCNKCFKNNEERR